MKIYFALYNIVLISLKFRHRIIQTFINILQAEFINSGNTRYLLSTLLSI